MYRYKHAIEYYILFLYHSLNEVFLAIFLWSKNIFNDATRRNVLGIKETIFLYSMDSIEINIIY